MVLHDAGTGPTLLQFRQALPAEGVAPDKTDGGGTDEQHDPDDREPQQTLEDEPDNRREKPEHEQNNYKNNRCYSPPNALNV